MQGGIDFHDVSTKIQNILDDLDAEQEKMLRDAFMAGANLSSLNEMEKQQAWLNYLSLELSNVNR